MAILSRKGVGVLIAAAVVMGIMAGSAGDVRADAITKVGVYGCFCTFIVSG